MAQWVNYLPHKLEGPSLHPQHLLKKLGIRHPCNLSLGWVGGWKGGEMRRRREADPWSGLTSCLHIHENGIKPHKPYS